MVNVQIVDDKSPYSSPASSRNSSATSLSSVASDPDHDESLLDRVSALVDIIPPTTRHAIATKFANTAALVLRGGRLAGSLVWIVTTSALLVGLPLAMTLEEEAKIVAEEKALLAQQQGAQQMLPAYPAANPDLTQPKAVVPPGF